MNLPVIIGKLLTTVKTFGGTAVVAVKKVAPEALIAGGIVGFGLTIAETVKATNDTNEILEAKERMLERIDIEYQDDQNNPNYQIDTHAISRAAKFDLVKAWALVGTTAATSVILILCGYRIIRGRYVATAMAYKMLEAGYERYRENVRNEFGNDVDWRMANSLPAGEIEKEHENQEEARKDNKKKIPKTKYFSNITNKIFDSKSSDMWKRYWIPVQAIDFVQQVERQLQDKVNSKGFAFLNDAYEMLGMPPTSQGSVVGWIKTPRNTHREKGTYISLGFANNETPDEEIRRIHASPSNDDIRIWLMPNCDGVIYQMIDLPFSDR